MKKYYAYVAKDVADYFETKLAECGGSIIKRELDLIDNGELALLLCSRSKRWNN